MISGVPMSGRSFVSLIMMASGFVWSIRFLMQAIFPLMPFMLTTRDLQLRPLWGSSCVDLDDVPVSVDDVDPSELNNSICFLIQEIQLSQSWRPQNLIMRIQVTTGSTLC